MNTIVSTAPQKADFERVAAQIASILSPWAWTNVVYSWGIEWQHETPTGRVWSVALDDYEVVVQPPADDLPEALRLSDAPSDEYLRAELVTLLGDAPEVAA